MKRLLAFKAVQKPYENVTVFGLSGPSLSGPSLSGPSLSSPKASIVQKPKTISAQFTKILSSLFVLLDYTSLLNENHLYYC